MFRRTVDSAPDTIGAVRGDLEQLYCYVGLPVGSSLSLNEVTKELYRKIALAFTRGHTGVWHRCREMREELIQRHVIDGEPLDPYFSVLDNIQDAVRAGAEAPAGDIEGCWDDAIRHAYDRVRIGDWSNGPHREPIHTREFEVARAAKRLQDRGYALSRSGHFISVEAASEARLVARLEELTAQVGGLNVARRMFSQLAPLYDAAQERFHLVNRPHTSGGGQPQIPFGYVLLLAAKYFLGTKPIKNTDENWRELMLLATDYAAVSDVQEYVPSAFRSFDAFTLVPYLRTLALYDTLFRIQQIRGCDVEKIARGVLRGLDFDAKRGAGWSINDVLHISNALLDGSRTAHGPHRFDMARFGAVCPSLDQKTIATTFDEVLSHPSTGANQNFSKPTDAPTSGPGGQEVGHTSYYRPLFSQDHKTFWLLDHSIAGIGCLESLLTQLRKHDKDFDGRLGTAIEDFLRAELAAHQIPSLTGSYVVDGEHGECDIVIEASDVVIFLEIKKKPWTRRAQAGMDAHVLLDLANSLLAAQTQAGWHEVRLRKRGFVELCVGGTVSRLELRGREVERIAVTLFDFGSFQDRILLKQFLEGTLNASFSSADPGLKKKFDELNELLGEIRTQISLLHPGATEIKQPFFHCWFLSVPQLLVLLDDVGSADEFKASLWKTRHMSTGSSDFYFDNAYMHGRISSSAATRRS
jgi:Holliday junction resolvase-like predicted endonuclease